MKKYLLPAIVLFAFGANNSFAQNVARCSSEDYVSQQILLHPEQAAERAAVDLQSDQFVQQYPNG
jgi:hypothetical protein